VQGGDPLNNGDGGPGYSFPDEFVPGLRHASAGVLSMANEGPDTNGSQFFITLRETNRLNYLHTVFGRVVRGLEVLPQLKQDDALRVKILRVGAAARAFRADDAAFAALLAKTKKYSGTPEPGPTAHFDDPDQLLPIDPPRAKNFNFKLANFERGTGIRIAARVFAKSPPPAEDDAPGKFMKALAAKLGVNTRGAVAAYFADEKDWRVWIIGDSTTPFFGRPPTAAELREGQAFHKTKEAFLEAVQATGDADFEKQKKAAPPDRPPSEKQHLKLQVDAVLDGLIDKLEPK
jgi:cyclophilin family peptidyl-prolyl cis-trans isomerase